MDNENYVLAQVDIDMDKAVASIQELKGQIETAKADVGKFADKSSAGYIEANATLKALNAELRTQEKTLIDIVKINNSENGSLNELKAKLSIVTKEWNNLSGEERLNSEIGKTLTAQKKALTEQLKSEEMATGNASRNVGNYAESLKPLKTELREITQQLAYMAMEGKENTAEFQRLTQRGGEIKDTLADISNRMKIMGSDTKNIDMLVGSFMAVGSAVQVAEGAMQLYGVENEDVQRGIQKMVAIQGILSGVQEVANALQKESAFMLGVSAVKSKLAAAGTAIYTAAVGTSTGALKAFRIALLATGIGAVIASVALLVANWDKLTSVFTSSGRAAAATKKAFESITTSIDDNNKAFETSQKISELLGSSKSELIKKEKEHNEELIKQLEYQRMLTSGYEDQAEGQKLAKEKTQQINDLIRKNSILSIEEIKAVEEEQKQQIEEQKKIQENKIKNAVAIAEYNYMIEKDNTEKKLSLNIKYLNQKRKQELSNEELTKGERLVINAKYDIEIRKAKEEQQRQLAQIEFNNLKNSTDLYLKSHQSKINNDKKLTQEDIDNEKARLETQTVLLQKNVDDEKNIKLIGLKAGSQEATNIESEATIAKQQLKQNELDSIKKLEDDFKLQNLAALSTDLQNQLIIHEQEGQSLIELKQKQLKIERLNEIETAKKNGADITLINKKYSNAQIELVRAEQRAKYSIYAGFAGAVSDLLGENTKVGKIAAIAQATINTYLGATAAFKDTTGGIIVRSLAAGAAIASGLASVKKIMSVSTSVKSSSGTSTDSGNSYTAAISNTSSYQNQASELSATAGAVGSGIISRNMIMSGLQQESMQTVLIIDDVTAKQKEQYLKNKTNII